MGQSKSDHPNLKRVYAFMPKEAHFKLKEIAGKKQILLHECVREAIIRYIKQEE